MRKKVLFSVVFVIVAIGSGLNVYFSNTLDKVKLQNAEALASVGLFSYNAGENYPNTGPAKIVDCPWWFTGDAKYCMCENQYGCTEVLCD
jgi:hypothetical protein